MNPTSQTSYLCQVSGALREHQASTSARRPHGASVVGIVRQMMAIMLLFWLCPLPSTAQQLKFGADGKFKILQFTDLHYILDDPKADVALQCIDELIASEKPDLVVSTGDNVWGRPGLPAMQRIVDHIDKFKVPFVILFGNHDSHEGGVSNEALYDLVRKARHQVMPDRGKRPSPDYVLPVAAHDGSRTAAWIYCLDSHSFPALKDVGTYDWIHFSQIAWYRRTSDSLRVSAGSKVLPALLFQHIPLPEYTQAATALDNVITGTRMERECAPDLNSGLFLAMKEAGDVMGMFVGHDHDNDYTTLWHGILLGYGRYSGGDNVYNHLHPNGARVIILKEGQRSFDTYIHLRGEAILHRTTYPDNYVKE